MWSTSPFYLHCPPGDHSIPLGGKQCSGLLRRGAPGPVRRQCLDQSYSPCARTRLASMYSRSTWLMRVW